MIGAINFRAVQEHFGLSQVAPVEKDWHVLRAFQAIVRVDAAPFRLVFAGGTALARAHKLVRRMSEDVDFKIVSPTDTATSNNQLRKQLGALRGRITAGLQGAGFAIDVTDARQLHSRDANRYTVYNLHYAEADGTGTVLRPTIQIDLTYATLRRPSVYLPVSSFVNEAYGRPPEITQVECVSVTETAAEKLVALTRRSAMILAGLSRRHRGRDPQGPQSLDGGACQPRHLRQLRRRHGLRRGGRFQNGHGDRCLVGRCSVASIVRLHLISDPLATCRRQITAFSDSQQQAAMIMSGRPR